MRSIVCIGVIFAFVLWIEARLVQFKLGCVRLYSWIEVSVDLLRLVECVDVADVGVILLLFFLGCQFVDGVAASFQVFAPCISCPVDDGEATHIWNDLFVLAAKPLTCS